MSWLYRWSVDLDEADGTVYSPDVPKLTGGPPSPLTGGDLDPRPLPKTHPRPLMTAIASGSSATCGSPSSPGATVAKGRKSYPPEFPQPASPASSSAAAALSARNTVASSPTSMSSTSASLVEAGPPCRSRGVRTAADLSSDDPLRSFASGVGRTAGWHSPLPIGHHPRGDMRRAGTGSRRAHRYCCSGSIERGAYSGAACLSSHSRRRKSFSSSVGRRRWIS